MTTMRWWPMAPAGLAALWLLAACVTINVYFPAAAAEQAADRIIRDVWGRDGQPAPSAETPPQSSREPVVQRVLVATLDLLIPTANAQQADININTPAISALRNSMTARHGQLEPFYASGALGLTRDGLIAVRDPNAVPLPDRNTVKQLVAQENSDRQRLYSEIANANGHPEWAGQIRDTFARRWIDNARGGWFYQDNGGQWVRK